MAQGYEQAFPRTEPGEFEIKVLPRGRLLECAGEGNYFDGANNLFGPLFRYIQQHDISMTTPVEARIDKAAMYFWVSESQVDKARESNDAVKVIDVPERTVAVLGYRGSYSQENYETAKAALLEWIRKDKTLEIIGEPYAIYWNGPMTPWFMKKAEVQVEVRIKV